LQETDNAIEIRYHEDRSIWPPNALTFSFYEHKRTWQNSTQSFAQSDCEFLNGPSGRTWVCNLPKPLDVTTAKLVVKRTPELDDNPDGARESVFYFQASEPKIKIAELICTDDDNVMLRFDIEVPDGLASVTLEEAGIDTSGYLSVFDAESVNAASFLQSVNKDAATKANGIAQLKGSVQLDRIYNRIDPPARLHICSNSGRCSVSDIAPLPKSDSCVF